ASVVELAVVVNHAAAETVPIDGRQTEKRLFPGKNFRRTESILAGKDIVDLQSQPIEGCFPPVVVGYDEREVTYQMRGILTQNAPFFQSFHDQRNVSLLEVSNAAVHQLGAPAGGAFAEIIPFE